MIYITIYNSPIGELLLASKNDKIIGLWFKDQKYYFYNIKEEVIENDNIEIFIKTKKWLDSYFKGMKPNIKEIELGPIGSEFRQTVWDLLCEIPYGKVVTYKELAVKVAKKMNKKHMSSQAIGGAVGHNPISIIIPCHRVVGTNGALTGYAAGIERKKYLLDHEQEIIK